MNPVVLVTVAEVLLKLVQAAPTIVKTLNDMKPLAAQLIAIAKGDTVTPEQRLAIEQIVDAQFAKSQEPLPPAQPGDPDYVEGGDDRQPGV